MNTAVVYCPCMSSNSWRYWVGPGKVEHVIEIPCLGLIPPPNFAQILNENHVQRILLIGHTLAMKKLCLTFTQTPRSDSFSVWHLQQIAQQMPSSLEIVVCQHTLQGRLFIVGLHKPNQTWIWAQEGTQIPPHQIASIFINELMSCNLTAADLRFQHPTTSIPKMLILNQTVRSPFDQAAYANATPEETICLYTPSSPLHLDYSLEQVAVWLNHIEIADLTQSDVIQLAISIWGHKSRIGQLRSIMLQQAVESLDEYRSLKRIADLSIRIA